MPDLSKLKRQKLILTVAAIAAAVVAAVYLADPVKEYWKNKERLVAARQSIAKVMRWHDEIVAGRQNEKALLEQARAGSAQGDLWTVVNRAMQELNLQDRSNISTTATSSTNMTELKLSVNGVSLEELVNLLHKISSSNAMVVVQSLTQLEADKQGKGLSCQMTLLAPKA